MKMIRLIIALIISGILVTSCLKKEDRLWEMDLLAPLAKGELTLEDLLKEDYLIKQSDNSIRFVYSRQLKRLELDTLLKIPDTSLSKSVSLKTIKVATPTFIQNYTLGELARNSGTQGQILLANHGKKIPIPPIDSVASPPNPINASDYFTSAKLRSGTLTIRITNGYPVELTNISFEIRNFDDKKRVISDTILSIPAGSVEERNYPLAGKTLSGDLEAEIFKMSSPGSGGTPVLIDTTDALEIFIKGNNMQVYSATAKFPQQDLVNDTNDVIYNMGGPKITFLSIHSGYIGFKAINTIQDSMTIYYSIPAAISPDGVPFRVKDVIPPAQPNDTVVIDTRYDISGYTIDLTVGNTTYNTFRNYFRLHIDSSGKLLPLSLNDTINVTYGLYDIIPEYAKGYLGMDTLRLGPSREKLTIFNDLKKASAELTNLKFSFSVTNGVGMPARVEIDQLSGTNTFSNKTVELQSPLMNNLTVLSAKDKPLQPTITEWVFDETNSNALDFIEIFPDILTYDINLFVNPGSNGTQFNDFIYRNSFVEAKANIEFPLELAAKGVQLKDTFEFDNEVIRELLTTDEVSGGAFTLLVYNNVPVEALAQAYFYHPDLGIIDSVFIEGPSLIKNALPDKNSGIVNFPVLTEVKTPFDRNRLEKIAKAESIIMKATLATKPDNQRIRFFSTYKIDFRIVAEFTYNSKF